MTRPVETSSEARGEKMRELSHEEGMALLDDEARRFLNISGVEFLRKWDAGEFDVDDPKIHTNVMWVSSLIGFAR